MKVRIDSCMSPSYWYADKIGQTMDVKESALGGNGFYIVEYHSSGLPNHLLTLWKHDCTILSLDD